MKVQPLGALVLPLAALALLGACDGETTLRPLVLTTVDPDIIDPLGGSRVVVSGSGFQAEAITAVEIGGVAMPHEVVSDTELHLTSAAVPAGAGLDLTIRSGERRATLVGALEAWSPAELDGARVFDAQSGVARAGPATSYEWQRLTAEVAPGWRARDGNTTTWLPSTGRYWMVAGWNGLEVPDGFSSVEPDTVYPPENTTDEVWSSPDGATWTLALAHGHGQFVRRHSHNTLLFRDKLWMIGGDYHTGDYNHDVVSSPDGVVWTVELGGDRPPPWSPRVLQVSGVFAGKLWTAGGQDVNGVLDETIHHNDVWSSEDGVHWTQVVADAPPSDTRWAGCGVLDGLVEHAGRMWLVGCARERGDAQGHTMIAQVWSTTDGATWTRHADPPWKGKIWHNVVAWDGKLWILFGFTYGDPAAGWTAGNANEAWYSDDGETWRALPSDMPVPGSHAQGIAVTADHLLLAGGNYNFGVGDGFDRSTWRLVPHRGDAVTGWTDRGPGALHIAPPTVDARPVLVADAFGAGRPGVQLDGSRTFLELATADVQTGGRTVLWVARAPYLPPAVGWTELYNPATTVVGGALADGYAETSIGFTDGELVVVNREDGFDALGSLRWSSTRAGADLQRGVGDVRLVGMTHANDGEGGALQLWIDGEPAGTTTSAFYGDGRGWTRIGAGLDGPGEGAWNRFGGTLGAVIILPRVADAATMQRIHQWARGRFDAR